MVFWIIEDLGTVALLEPDEDGTLVFDVRDIVDGKNNTPEYPLERVVRKFKSLVGTYYSNTPYGFRTAIRCRMGISRSNAFAAALIAFINKTDFEDGLNIVKSKVLRANPNMDIIDDVKYALTQFRPEYRPSWS